ncbi:SUKH-4 family immunity protein [Carboxylicivirga sp. RSCT41]|uniref:SUKH-4 family immunity protein n=1 Tax=Carboxylicivirga agarovorans TaxID=3417570 RepID=UPI003D338CF4
MNFESYKIDWRNHFCINDKVILYDLQEMELQEIPTETKYFLATYGLPKNEGSFYLNFDNVNYEMSTFNRLPLICDMFNLEIEDLSSMEEDYFTNYNIGSAGSGYPITINKKGEVRIIALDSTLSGQYEWTFINSSITQMAIFFIEFEKFTIYQKEKSSASSFSEIKVKQEDLISFVEKIKTIDSVATNKGSFWHSFIEEFEEMVHK